MKGKKRVTATTSSRCEGESKVAVDSPRRRIILLSRFLGTSATALSPLELPNHSSSLSLGPNTKRPAPGLAQVYLVQLEPKCLLEKSTGDRQPGTLLYRATIKTFRETLAL